MNIANYKKTREEQYAIRCKCNSRTHDIGTQNAEQEQETLKRICRDRESSFMHIAPKIENLLCNMAMNISFVFSCWLLRRRFYPFLAFSLCFFFFLFSSFVCFVFLSLNSYLLFCLGARYTDAIPTEMYIFIQQKINPQSIIMCECMGIKHNNTFGSRARLRVCIWSIMHSIVCCGYWGCIGAMYVHFFELLQMLHAAKTYNIPFTLWSILSVPLSAESQEPNAERLQFLHYYFISCSNCLFWMLNVYIEFSLVLDCLYFVASSWINETKRDTSSNQL